MSALRHLQPVDRETLRYIEGDRAVDVPVEHGFQPDDRVASHLYVDELQWRGQDGEPVPLSEQEAAVVVLPSNWVRDDEEDWEVRIVDRSTLRYLDGGRTADIPVDMGLRGQQAVVHLDRAQVGDAVAVQRVAAALEFLDVLLVLDEGQQPGGAPWPRT